MFQRRSNPPAEDLWKKPDLLTNSQHSRLPDPRYQAAPCRTAAVGTPACLQDFLIPDGSRRTRKCMVYTRFCSRKTLQSGQVPVWQMVEMYQAALL
ncbi:hypothetical protein AV530_011323 [Patagioenas fasciata monilis]|uniref:Uncharacterized protein n=1 Tax=Patagioenas fasciata monilis TaxID=372326 RepID=A0A1V4KNZ3_PATFA|nr:hypothetical protein AV530_011323 [Patagioenas fasciata monilis]